MAHYIGMNGIIGCLPDSCASYQNRKDAVESLADLLELTDEQKAELRRYGYVACTQEQGADYAEVISCSCGKPSQHNDY